MVMFSNNVEPANGFLLRYLHRKAVEAYQNEELNSAQRRALLHVLDWIPQLWYHLHTFLEKHSTSDFLIGKMAWKRWKLKEMVISKWSNCHLLQVPASSCRVLYLWQSSGSGSSTSGTTPSYRTSRRELKTASRWALKTSTAWQQNKNRKLFNISLSSQVHGHKAAWEDPVEWVRGTLPWPNAQQDQSKLFHLPPPSIGPANEEKKPPKDTPPPSTLESDPLVSSSDKVL